MTYANEYYGSTQFLSFGQGDNATGTGGSSPGLTLQVYVGELKTLAIPTASDLTSDTLSIEIDNIRGESVATIGNASITKTAASISFTTTAAISSTARTMRYAIRKASSEQVAEYGFIVCDGQPLA